MINVFDAGPGPAKCAKGSSEPKVVFAVETFSNFGRGRRVHFKKQNFFFLLYRLIDKVE